MLENDLIKLRPLEPNDVDALYLWENNPENWKISQTVAPYSRHALMEYINSTGDVYSDKQLRLIIEHQDTGERLGAVDLFDCDFKNRRAGVGILIASPADRNKGIGKAVLELVIAYCFDTLDMHQLYCNVLSQNAHSLHIFQKAGFTKVGLKKQWIKHDGAWHDEWLLQLIRNG